MSRRGEVLCVIGPSGSGKSTFLRCINQLETIDGGALWVNGELVGYRRVGNKLYALSESEIARQRLTTGMVFQRFNLFPHMTALENVIEGPVQVLNTGREAESIAEARRCSRVSDSPTSAMHFRSNCPAASSSAWPLPARWRCTRSSCCSTSPPPRSTRNWSAKCSP